MKTIYKNKKIKFLIAGLALVLVASLGFLVQSCSQDIIDEISPNSNNQQSFNTKVNFSSKIINPFDCIGQYHNDGLRYVIDKYNSKSELKGDNDKESLIKDLTKSFMKENDIQEVYNLSLSNENVLSTVEQILNKTITSDKIRLKSDIDGLLSSKQKFYCSKIESIFENKEISSPQMLVDNINDIELDIINSQSLTELEKDQLLIASAVAKYSSIFWIELLLEKDTKSIVRLKGDVETGNSFLDWWANKFLPKASEVIAADFTGAASGAVMGAIAGGTVGSLAPGPGTVTVGVTGAVVGGSGSAIGSSAVEGFIVLFF